MIMSYFQKIFTQWDTNESGTLPREVIKQALRELDFDLSEEFIDDIISQSQPNENGEIEYWTCVNAFAGTVGISADHLQQCSAVSWDEDLSPKIDHIRRRGLTAVAILLLGFIVLQIRFGSQINSWIVRHSLRLLIGMIGIVVFLVVVIYRNPGLHFVTSLARVGLSRFYYSFWSVFDRYQNYKLFRLLGWTGPQILVPRDEHSVGAVLRQPKKFARMSATRYRLVNAHSVFGAAPGANWLRYRLAFNDYFTKEFRADMPLIRALTEERIAAWVEMEEIDLLRELSKLEVELKGRIFFQTSFGCFNEFAEPNFSDIVDTLLQPPVQLIGANPNQIVEMFQARMWQAIKQSTRPGSVGYICKELWESGEFSADEALQNASMFVLSQASIPAIFWTLYRAAAMGTSADLRADSSKLLQALKEELRIHPPVMVLPPRVALEDTTIDELSIPKDTQAFVSPFFVHHNPALWEDSEQFCPHHWQLKRHQPTDLLDYRTDANDEARRPAGSDKSTHPLRYFPFGYGQHKCLGRKYAVEEIFAICDTILKHVELTVIEDHGLLQKPIAEQVKMHNFNSPVHDIKLKVKPV